LRPITAPSRPRVALPKCAPRTTRTYRKNSFQRKDQKSVIGGGRPRAVREWGKLRCRLPQDEAADERHEVVHRIDDRVYQLLPQREKKVVPGAAH
jgi:hypothetical protein